MSDRNFRRGSADEANARLLDVLIMMASWIFLNVWKSFMATPVSTSGSCKIKGNFQGLENAETILIGYNNMPCL